MAGSGSRIFGTLLLIVGAVLLVAGIAAVIYGAMERGEATSGFVEDQDRKELGEEIMTGGALAAVAGLLLLIGGVIFYAVGGAAQRRGDRRDMMHAFSATSPRAEAPAPAILQGPAPVSAAPEPGGSDSRSSTIIAVLVIALFLLAAIAMGTWFALQEGEADGSDTGRDPISDLLLAYPNVVDSDGFPGIDDYRLDDERSQDDLVTFEPGTNHTQEWVHRGIPSGGVAVRGGLATVTWVYNSTSGGTLSFRATITTEQGTFQSAIFEKIVGPSSRVEFRAVVDLDPGITETIRVTAQLLSDRPHLQVTDVLPDCVVAID